MIAGTAEQTGKRIIACGSILLLLSIALFSFTGKYAFLGIPFAAAAILWIICDWKSFYWFFLFTIPLSAEITLFNGSLSTSVPDEQFMWLMVPMTALVLAYNYKKIPGWFLRHPLTLILFLQFVWLLIAVGFSQNHFLSFKFLAAKIWFLCSFVVVPAMIFKSTKDIKKAFLIFGIPVILHAIFAFSWHATLDFFYLAYNTVVQPFYVNHVDYATILSMVFPLMVGAYQLSKEKPKQRRLLAGIIIFLIPAIYFAGARAAMLAIVFAFVVAFAIRKRLVQWLMPAFYGFVLLGLSLLIYDNAYIKYRPELKYTATQRSFSDLVTATFTGRDMSSMERFYRWIASVKMSSEHPVVGVGPNNFYDHYKNYTVPMFRTWVSRNPERSTTHNYFLFMLVEQGWPAMILYGILVVAVMVYGQRIYHRAKTKEHKVYTMALIMMFAAGFVNNFFSELIETHKVGALFYLSIVLLIVMDNIIRKSEEEEKSLS